MLCQNCGKAEACVHLTDIVDGEKRTLELCKGCLSEEGWVIDPGVIEGAAQLQKMIIPLMETVTGLAKTSAPSLQTATCPRCGMSWEEFRSKSRLGCPNDYRVFRQPLDELLLGIHGETRHRGRVPARVQVQLERKRRLFGLRKKLEGAIECEDFESAANLRDEISAIEAEDQTS